MQKSSERKLKVLADSKIIHEKTNCTLCLNSKGGRNGIDGLQPSLQDRVYDSNGISTAITTSQFFMPNYLIRINNN